MTEPVLFPPDLIPDQFRETPLYVFQPEDLASAEAVKELVSLMFDFPEREFQLFCSRQGCQIGTHLAAALAHGSGSILVEEGENFCYKHPSPALKHTFIHIPGGEAQHEWQRELVERGPMFTKLRLRLTERARRERAIRQHIQIERELDTNPVEAKPGIFGFTIDLFKLFRQIQRLFRRRRERSGA